MILALWSIIGVLIYLLLWAATRPCYWAKVPRFYVNAVRIEMPTELVVGMNDPHLPYRYHTGMVETEVTLTVESWDEFEAFCAHYGALPETDGGF